MSAGLGAFDYDGVGHIVVLGEPFAAQQHRGACRRDDGRQLRAGPLGEEGGQVERQPRAREDDVGLLGYGRAHHVGEVRHGDHDVHADDALRGGAGLAQLLAQACDAGLAVVLRQVAVDGAQPRGGDDADSALGRDGRGQSRKRYAYAHAPLHDGDGGREVSDFQ